MIGIFDSGIGGMSVWKELIALIPHADYTYVADSGHCPYGPKTDEEIIDRSVAICNFLIAQGAQIIVVACNTATAASVATLRKTFSIPVVGMEPAIKPAAMNTKSGVIGVLATRGTFRGKLYNNTRNLYACDKKIIEQIGEGLVEIVENGTVESEQTYKLLFKYIEPMLENNADHLVLGCTHYPFLIDPIKKITGNRVTIVNPAPAIAKRVHEIMEENNIVPDENNTGFTSFYTTGNNTGLITKMATSIISTTKQIPQDYKFNITEQNI